MEPTFSDGSILLVDRGITAIKTDGVYVLAKNDAIFVKRVQRNFDGSLAIKSDNPNYDNLKLSAKEQNDLSVLGRVLTAWNPKKL